MRQILQDFKTGKIEITEVPVPLVKEGHLLIEIRKSLISLGTERMLINFGKSNWLSRIKENPDKVKQVFSKDKNRRPHGNTKYSFKQVK